MKNYYEILQVDKNATFEIINRVYKYHIKKNHPDLFEEQEKEKAKQRVQEFNEAYEILSNKEKRQEYDKNLENLQKELENTKTNLESIKRLEEENSILHQQLLYKDKLLKEILNELNVPYSSEYLYFNEQEYNVSEKEKENNEKKDINTTKYINYMKIKLYKIIFSIFLFIVLIFIFSYITGNNYMEFFKSLF